MSSRYGGSSSRNRPRTGAPWISRTNRPPGSGSSRAYSPIQETIASGRVKYWYTRSGGASICTQAVTGSAGIVGPRGLISGFDGMLKPLQMVRPELGEEVSQTGQPFWPDLVQALLATRPDGYQACVPEHLQVQGDGLLGDVELLGDLVHRARSITHQPQNRPPARVGKSVERRFAHEAHNSKYTRVDLYKHRLVTYTSQIL